MYSALCCIHCAVHCTEALLPSYFVWNPSQPVHHRDCWLPFLGLCSPSILQCGDGHKIWPITFLQLELLRVAELTQGSVNLPGNVTHKAKPIFLYQKKVSEKLFLMHKKTQLVWQNWKKLCYCDINTMLPQLKIHLYMPKYIVVIFRNFSAQNACAKILLTTKRVSVT